MMLPLPRPDLLCKAAPTTDHQAQHRLAYAFTNDGRLYLTQDAVKNRQLTPAQMGQIHSIGDDAMAVAVVAAQVWETTG